MYLFNVISSLFFRQIFFRRQVPCQKNAFWPIDLLRPRWPIKEFSGFSKISRKGWANPKISGKWQNVDLPKGLPGRIALAVQVTKFRKYKSWHPNCFELPSDWLLSYWESQSEGSSKQLLIKSPSLGVSGFVLLNFFHL